MMNKTIEWLHEPPVKIIEIVTALTILLDTGGILIEYILAKLDDIPLDYVRYVDHWTPIIAVFVLGIALYTLYSTLNDSDYSMAKRSNLMLINSLILFISAFIFGLGNTATIYTAVAWAYIVLAVANVSSHFYVESQLKKNANA